MMNRSTRWGLALALAVALGVGTAAQKDAPVEKQLQAAIHKEMVDGDLKGAIETYRTVVAQAGSNRALAAQALLRMAECHTKLGDDQARQAYERLVREYGDMPEAKTARARIGAAGAATARATPPTDRIVAAGEGITWGDGRVSPDGRYIAYPDFVSSGNVMLRDLAAGADRPLTGNRGWGPSMANSAAFSPDSRQVAYGWRTSADAPARSVNELRVLPVDPAAGGQPRVLYSNSELSYIAAKDWSADGQWIAVVAYRPDRSTELAVVAVRDGTFRSLRTVGWDAQSLKMFFSPDGKYLAYHLPSNETEPKLDVFVMAVDGSRGTSVVEHAAQDVLMGWSSDGRRLLFASDRSGSLGLWAVPVAEGRALGAPSLIKPEIASIRSLGLTTAGTLHIVRDASTESLQIAPIDLEAGRLTGPAVLENFRSLRPSWSPDGSGLAYAVVGRNGVGSIVVRSLGSGQVRELPQALEFMLEPVWMPDGESVVVSGRSRKGISGIYRIDVSTGKASLVAEANRSRVRVSPDGRKLYYLLSSGPVPDGRSTRLVEHDLVTGGVREVRRVQGNGGEFVGELSPDGRTLALVRVDANDRTSTLTLTPTVAGAEPIRRELAGVFEERPSWLPDGQALLAQARDGALWIVPIDGAAPRKLALDTTGWLVHEGIRLSPSGTHIAFFAGKNASEVWALESVAQR